MTNQETTGVIQDEVLTVPDDARGIIQCAEWQIQILMNKTAEGLTVIEEDCIDDVFCLCDLSVVKRKLQA